MIKLAWVAGKELCLQALEHSNHICKKIYDGKISTTDQQLIYGDLGENLSRSDTLYELAIERGYLDV